ncbi:MAG: hypothetical protein ACKO23_10905, partial [Gemmataceae bacterium]
MEMEILDLDQSLRKQPEVLSSARAVIHLIDRGKRLRLACSWPAFRSFQNHFNQQVGCATDKSPVLRFIGSGDFHHLTLALLNRFSVRFNLLVLDNHPDWMRFLPFLHCGTWLYHASCLPNINRIFHLGGNVDFDNGFRHLAPTSSLRQKRIVVFPEKRQFTRGFWKRIPNQNLRLCQDGPITTSRVRELLSPWAKDLATLPLYISLDKDVMTSSKSRVNWDSGDIYPEEVLQILDEFRICVPQILGMDVVGDWSPVDVKGVFRKVLHLLEHANDKDSCQNASDINQEINLMVYRWWKKNAGIGAP